MAVALGVGADSTYQCLLMVAVRRRVGVRIVDLSKILFRRQSIAVENLCGIDAFLRLSAVMQLCCAAFALNNCCTLWDERKN
jgi:hypothetical protein